jgi:hypothetical protein
MMNDPNERQILYPQYDFITTPDKVLLVHINVTVTVGNESEQTFAPVYLRLLPVPLLVLECTHSGHPRIYKDILLAHNIVKKVESQHISNARYLDRYIQPDSGYVISQWQVNEPLLNTNTTNELKEIIFHLLNFDVFHSYTQFVESRRIGISDKPELVHILDLKSNNWHIEISSIYETKTHVNHIRQHPELRLTHMGRIRRTSSGTFALDQGQELIETLNSLFSFALGYNYTLVCPVGSDTDGKCWHSYNAPRRSRYKRQNWYDAFHQNNEQQQQLELLFPFFIHQYNELDWRDTLRSMIYWYTTANQAQELEVAVVAIMSSFEKIIPRFSTMAEFKTGFRSTVVNLEMIFQNHQIPNDIPEMFNGLYVKTTNTCYKITSMIHLLAEARNSYIHENYKLSRRFTSAEMLTLIEYGLEMIELLILSVCTYNNQYVSRIIHNGKLVDVPWRDYSIE